MADKEAATDGANRLMDMLDQLLDHVENLTKRVAKLEGQATTPEKEIPARRPKCDCGPMECRRDKLPAKLSCKAPWRNVR
jgi:hypothetical protein